MPNSETGRGERCPLCAACLSSLGYMPGCEQFSPNSEAGVGQWNGSSVTRTVTRPSVTHRSVTLRVSAGYPSQGGLPVHLRMAGLSTVYPGGRCIAGCIPPRVYQEVYQEGIPTHLGYTRRDTYLLTYGTPQGAYTPPTVHHRVHIHHLGYTRVYRSPNRVYQGVQVSH